MSVQIHHAGGGSPGGGSSPVAVATLTLTDAQIKDVGTPYILVAATETLGYSAPPTQLFVPMHVFVSWNNNAGAYTNIDTPTCEFIIGWGSDWSMDVMKLEASYLDQGSSAARVSSAFNALYETQDFSTPAEGILHKHGLEGLRGFDVDGGIEDNALFFLIRNNNGDLTGGDSANSLKVTVIYYTVGL